MYSLLLLFAARRLGPLLQVLDLAVERAHAVDRAVDAVDQALAFVVGEAQLAHRHATCARSRAPGGSGNGDESRGRFFWLTAASFSCERRNLLVELVELVDLGEEFLQPLVDNLFGDFLFVEGDQLLDGADAFFEVLAQGEEFTNHDRRARKRLQDAVLATLDALGDFDFAFAREQRNGSHLAQIHADGIIGFFQRAGGEVEFDVLGAFFYFFEFFFQIGRRPFRAFEHIDSLRPDRGQQIFQVFRRVHIVRDKVVDLIIGQISLLFACVDQLFYVVVLVVKCQDRLSSGRPPVRGRQTTSAVGVVTELCARRTNLKSIAPQNPVLPGRAKPV